jgi:hypothetical protein
MFESAVVEQRIDAELAKLGLRGVTVTAASGDGASHFAFGPFSGSAAGLTHPSISVSLPLPRVASPLNAILTVSVTLTLQSDTVSSHG